MNFWAVLHCNFNKSPFQLSVLNPLYLQLKHMQYLPAMSMNSWCPSQVPLSSKSPLLARGQPCLEGSERGLLGSGTAAVDERPLVGLERPGAVRNPEIKRLRWGQLQRYQLPSTRSSSLLSTKSHSWDISLKAPPQVKLFAVSPSNKNESIIK